MARIKSRHLVGLTVGATITLLAMFAIGRHTVAQERSKVSTMVMRVAFFPPEVSARDYRDWIEHHLFPTLQTAPGYGGTYIARLPENGQSLSVSFWESAAAAQAAEEAVGRVARLQPSGTVPRPEKIEKYVVEYHDVPRSHGK